MIIILIIIFLLVSMFPNMSSYEKLLYLPNPENYKEKSDIQDIQNTQDVHREFEEFSPTIDTKNEESFDIETISMDIENITPSAFAKSLYKDL